MTPQRVKLMMNAAIAGTTWKSTIRISAGARNKYASRCSTMTRRRRAARACRGIAAAATVSDDTFENAHLRLSLRPLRARVLRGPVVQGRPAGEVPELWEAAAAAAHAARDRLQGIRLVQDRQPCDAEERIELRGREEDRQEGGRGDEREAAAEGRGGVVSGGSAVATVVARARATVQRFFDDDGAFLAGGVAYQIFFALIPLLALIIGALSFLFGPDRAQREFEQVLRQVYPSATAQESRLARELVSGRALSLGVGAVGTILTALGFYRAVETAFTIILGRTGRRTFVRGNLAAIGFVLALLALAAVSFGLSYGAAALGEELIALGFGGLVRAVLRVASPLAGVVVGFVFFYLVYGFVPRPHVPVRFAVTAALVSAVLWEVAKLAFGFFTRALGTFAAYGPLAFAAGLLTWIYLTAVIILMGAEVMKTRGAT